MSALPTGEIDVGAIVQALASRLDGRIEELLSDRFEQLHQAIEQLRDEFAQTVQVLEGNDQVLLGEIRAGAGMPEPQVVANEAWARFIRNEATAIGLKFMAPKS